MEADGSIHAFKLLIDQGKYADAEPMYREALDGRRRELGDAHPDTLRSIHNLANLLDDQGKYADAEALLRDHAEKDRRLTASRSAMR